jgi:DNA-binding MarR family transcriptional regulator
MKPTHETTSAAHAARPEGGQGWPHEPESGEPDHEAWRHLILVMHDLKQYFPKVTAEFDLSAVQARVLCELAPGNPVPMSALAETLACDASNVTGLVDRLESRGLIERRSADHDRRIKILAMTKAGEALRSKLIQRMSMPAPALAALSPSDQRALTKILGRILGKGLC